MIDFFPKSFYTMNMNENLLVLPDYITTEETPLGFKLTTTENTLIHTHEYVEIFYLLNGTAEHKYENNPTQTLSAGDAFIMLPSKKHMFIVKNPGSAIHRDIFVREGFFKKVCDFISPTLYDELLNSDQPHIAHFSQNKLNYIENQVSFISQTLTDALSQNNATIKCFAVALLEPFISSPLENHLHNFPSWFKELLTNFNKIEYIKQGLNRILMGTNYDRKYLCRVFKKNMGITMTEYLNRIRLEHALTMIQNTNKNILNISQELGFSSISYFNTSFKKRYGISPIMARKYK